MEPSLLDSSSTSQKRFPKLRGVRWRIDLGVLSSSLSVSIDDLRRAAADARRRYASLRRRMLMDFHLPRDVDRSPDLTMDNPLSQNPDSTWSHFFKNVELEKLIDQDLSQLHRAHGSFFQTPTCQTMLRRMLFLWCLRHPEYGYRREMHELLTPLVYVLLVDLDHLSQVQKAYESHFSNEFDEMSFSELTQVSDNRLRRSISGGMEIEKEGNQDGIAKVHSIDELDPDTKEILLLSDSYGAEGELGVLLSERFLEHDAYTMFDSLMNGARGVVAMADLFSSSPVAFEVSSSFYYLLSIVDSSLHSHLVELGVEPQYFALRWLHVLFGREFDFDDLLMIWDELFSSPNSICIDKNAKYRFKILCAPRGAFIASMAVAMLLHLRSSLLATENATFCLQRILSFPKNSDMKILLEKAKSLEILAIDSNKLLSSSQETSNKNKLAITRGYSLSLGSSSARTPPNQVPDSYWEEKWNVLHKATETMMRSNGFLDSSGMKFLGERSILSRTESHPSPADGGGRKNKHFSVRHKLLDDFSQDINSVVEHTNSIQSKFLVSNNIESSPLQVNAGNHFMEELNDDNNIRRMTSDCTAEETCLSGECSSIFSIATHCSLSKNKDNDLDKSSITSNSCICDNDQEASIMEELCCRSYNNQLVKDDEVVSAANDEPKSGQEFVSDDRKPLASKFQWFWKFSRSSAEGNLEKGGNQESERASAAENTKNGCSTPNFCSNQQFPRCEQEGRCRRQQSSWHFEDSWTIHA
ncbi:hypothetical protein MUK42_37573 [Musa troglodytarum]|uniref:Rab-GAP TBC domain-containing protein n=1 Tax=Musa troglodytarum TaxID=320322 RepID=A0A9E7KI53_9LILI|nr:hypothetical protein MUK42_37573 [Musa troglodytarum]